MKAKSGEEFISCLASNYKQPIATFVDHLLTVQLPDSLDAPPRSSEVDYATCLVVMLVLQFEAWISRARYFDQRPSVKRSDKESVRPWLKSLNDPKLKSIIGGLDEVYFLRDAIVHNHIWTYKQRWIQGDAHYSDFNLDLTWQSSADKVRRFVSGSLPLPSFPRSKKLNVIVVPSFVGRRDVAVVFKTVKDALKILDELGYVEIVPKVPHVHFDGKPSFPFWGLIGRIQRSFLASNQG